MKENINSTVDRKQDVMATVNKKIKITIVGDSQLRFLNTEKMSNSHHKVNKDFKPEMKIREAIQKTRKSDSDVIIIHESTNKVCKASPEELSQEILATLDKIQENNPRAKIVYSAASRRKDSHESNAKICQVNKILSEEILTHGFDITSNENILFSNLSNDRLHLNEGGVRKFAGIYCQRCLCANKHNRVSMANYSRKRNGLKIASLNIVSFRKYKDELGISLSF